MILSLDDLPFASFRRLALCRTSHPAHFNYALQTVRQQLAAKCPAADLDLLARRDQVPPGWEGAALTWPGPALTAADAARLAGELARPVPLDALVILYHREDRRGYDAVLALAAAAPARWIIESYYVVGQNAFSAAARRFVSSPREEFRARPSLVREQH